jgi:hypothetical protein
VIQTILNAHSLFSGERADRPFLSGLTVPDDRLNRLRKARDLARAAISDGFRHWEALADDRTIIERTYARAHQAVPKLRPKFRRQGSYAYRTLNLPAYTGQQIDFDDGMFLPISFFMQQGAQSPAITSEGYFYLVEKALEPLCKTKGWKLAKKDCCVRIELDERSHLDIALYAIPDQEYEVLIEKAARADATMDAAILAFDEFSERAYHRLDAHTIMLAQRSAGWTESDPRAIEDWFLQALEIHGEQLRRVCRYVKAWRDHRWRLACRVSSIALMKCAVDVYDAFGGSFDNTRDDAALLMVASKLPDYFADPKGIKNPVLNKVLNGEWTPEQRSEYVDAARELQRAVTNAIQTLPDPEMSVDRFTQVLGARIPNDADLVVPVAAERLVRSYEARRVSSPHVDRTRSG